MDVITIINNSSEIVATNFFESTLARKGGAYLSTNAGYFRLLIPPGINWWPEIKTASEVIVSRGAWPQMNQADALELLFEDHSDYPFAIHLGTPQIDRFPLPEDEQKQFWFSAWTKSDVGIVKLIDLPAFYRRVPTVPWLKARGEVK